MNDDEERRWLRRHAVIAPFGIFAVTFLLVIRAGRWDGWGSLELAANLVDLGAVLYGMVAVLVEGGIKMVFWALEERRKMIKARQDQGRAMAIAELMADGDGIPQTKEDLEQWARDRDIPLDKLPPGWKGYRRSEG